MSCTPAHVRYIEPLRYKPCSALIQLDSVAANKHTHTHTITLSHAHPLTSTCLNISSQHLAWHQALLSISEQFKWIIGLLMQRKWIVHHLISNQSPLSCPWCKIRLALCEMTQASVPHCNTLWVPEKSGPTSMERAFSSQTTDIFHFPPNDTLTPCLH